MSEIMRRFTEVSGTKFLNFVETLSEFSRGGSIGTSVDGHDGSGMILYV